MGIQGLTSFLQKNKLFDDKYVLKDTLLIIDGLNLANELYYQLQTTSGYDYLYGGDYTRYSAYIRRFFSILSNFNIHPLVIMDGSFNPSHKKQRLKLARQMDRLEHAQKAYTNPDSSTADGSGQNLVNGLLNIYTFLKVLEQMSILNYKTVYDSAAVIVYIAHDLGAPVLSSDSDFYVHNLPAGVITIRSLLEALDSDILQCSIFKATSYQSIYPNLNLDLVQLLGLVLSKDSLCTWIARCVVSQENWYKKIPNFLGWIAQFQTKAAIMRKIEQWCDPSSTKMCNDLKYIKKRFIQLRTNRNFAGLTVEAYLEANKQKLFPPLWNLPLWVHEKFIKNQIQRRFVSIWRSKVEWFRPLMEDCTISRASADCTIPPMQYIYGLLRNDKADKAGITCFYRKGASQAEEIVKPTVILADGQMLPIVGEMELLGSNDRIKYFWNILGLEPSIVEEIKDLFPEVLQVNEHLAFDQFTTLIISLICLCRDFCDDFWIEFLYGLLVNLLFPGYFCSEVDRFLKLDLNLTEKLTAVLEPFNVVSNVSYSYKPRIVHLYNAFQSSLKNIRFVAQLLNLGDQFNADRAVFGLQGSCIYNVTLETVNQNRPLEFVERELLLGESNLKMLFRGLVKLIMKNSSRKLFLLNSAGEESDLGGISIVNQKSDDEREKYFIRAQEGKGSVRYLKKLDVLGDLLNL